MIEFVEGALVSKTPSQAVVAVGGMGLRSTVSLTTYDDLPAVGHNVRLWTHLQLREDEIQLFAFSKQDERRLFQHLITVNGIGPKLAMVMLSAARPEVIRRAIAEGDSDRLKSIPRIGTKIAERIVLELKKKVSEEGLEPTIAGTGTAREVPEAVNALCALGFTRTEAEKAVDGALKRGGISLEELVKLALRTP